jgi:hypothetical protein
VRASLKGLTADLSKALRVARDLPGFVRSPLDSRRAIEIVQWRLQHREARFLAMAERTIYGRPGGPYWQLLRSAGCEAGDLRALVSNEGLEAALLELDARGVYLTLDEFKGRRDVIRGSARFSFQESDFDNPTVIPLVEAWSGGTRGPRTSVKMSLPYFADLAVNTALAFEAHQLRGQAHAVWLQASTPILIYARLGQRTLAWFHPVSPLAPRVEMFHRLVAALSRLSGLPMPYPEHLDLRQPERLVHWLAARRQEQGGICVTTNASSAVRICVAAREAGVSLDGVCFITLGEPFTETKRALVLGSGARALVRYAFTEAGIIGYACATAEGSDDLHFFEDSYALIRRPRSLGAAGPVIEALRYSSLLETAPKILFNVESGDSAHVERQECGCAMGRLGLHQHLREIRSFEKLSGEGMTFIRSDLLRVLEEELPNRFGGATADYQALEEEDRQGLLRLVLLVSPKVGPVDESKLGEAFLAGLARGGGQGQEGVDLWKRADTLVVRRQEPVATSAGKILPFHLARLKSGRPSTR